MNCCRVLFFVAVSTSFIILYHGDAETTSPDEQANAGDMLANCHELSCSRRFRRGNQPGEARDGRRGMDALCHPLTSSKHVHGRCGKECLKPELFASNVACTAYFTRPNSLSNRCTGYLDISVLILQSHLARSAHHEMAHQAQSSKKTFQVAVSLWSHLTF